MRPTPSQRPHHLRRHAVAAAAASLLLGLPLLPAQAQPYYSVSGTVDGFPGNPFIGFNPNQSLFNAGGNTLLIGNGAAGSFSMLAGAHLIAAGLFYGDLGGNGSGTISGAGTVAELTGTGNRLQVGNWGTGALTVSGGALLDAAANANACLAPGASCASVIGHAAGSTASLTVTGIGSELRTLRPLAIAQADAYTQAKGGFDFGTPGADTHASVNVFAGGTLRSDGAYVSNGPVGAAATGTERTFANVVIDGTGSQWIVSPDRLAGGTANFNASSHANATSTITVGNGGRLAVDGSNGGVGANMGLGNGGQSTLTVQSGGIVNVGGATGSNGSFVGIGWGPTGSGMVTVTGTGSQFNLTGAHAGMSVGAGNGGSGRLDVSSGGMVTVGNFSIGARSTGVVNVDGGSLQMNGTDGRLLIGDWGVGTLNISGGGVVDATLNPANCIGNWCGNLVGFRAGSTAALSIAGAGSELRLVRNLDVASIWVDQYGGTSGATSTATVSIANGGSLRSAGVNVGPGAGGPDFLGNGNEQSIATITIDGAGSQWVAAPSPVDGGGVGFNLSNHAHAHSFMTLSHGGLLRIDSGANDSWANLTVGGSGQATLDVQSGASVQVIGAVNPQQSHVNIGQQPGSVGTVTVTGLGSELVVGGHVANLNVGGGGGSTGTLNVFAGGRVSSGGLNVGANGGTGTVTIDNATLEVNNGYYGRLVVGANGTGSLAVTHGGLLNATVNPLACVGVWCGNTIANGAGRTGVLSIDGPGSEVRLLRSFNTANAWVDDGFGLPGGTADATISISNGGTLRTQSTDLSGGVGGPNSNGLERSVTHVTIDGPSSHWVIGANTMDGWDAWLNMSNHPRAQSFVTLTNGGHLFVDGLSSDRDAGLIVGNGGQATLNILSGSKVWVLGGNGTNSTYANIATAPGSTGSVTVSGAGSEFRVDGRGSHVIVGSGSGSTGTLQIADQAWADMGGLSVGSRGATGSVIVDHAGVEIHNGVDGRLIIGDAGIGSVLVTNGGVIDATVVPENCPPFRCGNVIANRAGSTGSLTVSGAGSEVLTLRNFTVGSPFADQFGGSPGGVATGTVNVLAGGTLRTEGATLGAGPGGTLSLGTEESFANALIDGPGSQWIVTRNTVDNAGAALMSLGTHANATANVTVSNGGLLRIDGTGGVGPNSGINIGSNGKGTLVLTGNGSRLETFDPSKPPEAAPLGQFINVGANSSAGDGSFQVLAGATAESLFFNVGRNSGKGTLLIDGVGSQLTLSGVNTDAGSPGAAGGNIGRNGGTGSMTVKNGGRFLITDAGMDDRAVGSPGLNVGRDLNGTGALTITGAGSTVEVVTTSLGLAPGVADNNNPFVTIGGRGPSAATTGELMVSDGGKLILTGNAVSTIANGRTTALHIGGRSPPAGICTDCSGSGTVTVTGAGSEIIVQGYDAYIGVGRTAGGTGVLNVLDHGRVSSTSLVIGSDGNGTVNVDNATIALSGYRTDSSQVGAASGVGRGAGGVGTLNLGHGASLTIVPSVLAGGMSIGGDQFFAGGTGTVNLSGGSSLTFGGSLAGNRLTIGRSGNATMTLTGASLVDVGALTETRLGVDPGSTASLNVSGGSQFRTGIFGVGGFDESVAAGTASASFSGAGTELNAYGATGLIGVGFGGNGSLSITNQATLKGILLAAGAGTTGTGTITLNNATVDLSGQANDPNIAVAGAGLYLGGVGGVGTANIAGGSVVTITNNGNLGANLNLGGFPDGPLGAGTLNVSGASQLKLIANPGLAIARIGHDGAGVLNLAGASGVDLGLGGLAYVADAAGSSGSLTIVGGSLLKANEIGIGGSSSDATAGGVGTAIVTGAGSELRAEGATGFITVGRNAIGTLTVSNQAKLSGIVTNIGRAAGGIGTLTVDNAVMEMTGQQTAANLRGATLGIGVAGGTGSVNIGHGSLVTLSNPGTAEVWLNLGGSPLSPTGTGTLNVSGASQVRLVAGPGLAIARIGHDGSGTATFSGASLLDVGVGDVIIAGEPGSSGTLTLNDHSVLNANYVGVGSLPGGIDGGTGKLFVNGGSIVNATTVEIGTHSLVGGSDGTIHANVIVRGTLSPGNSPGRLTIDGGLKIDGPGRLTIDIGANPDGSYSVDELVLTQGSSYDLNTLQVSFNFLDNTDPNAFAATGKLDMDTFLRSSSSNGAESGLSSTFAQGSSWNTVLSQATFSATSEDYAIQLNLDNSGGGTFSITTQPIPEPGTWLMFLGGIAMLGAIARCRSRRPDVVAHL